MGVKVRLTAWHDDAGPAIDHLIILWKFNIRVFRSGRCSLHQNVHAYNLDEYRNTWRCCCIRYLQDATDLQPAKHEVNLSLEAEEPWWVGKAELIQFRLWIKSVLTVISHCYLLMKYRHGMCLAHRQSPLSCHHAQKTFSYETIVVRLMHQDSGSGTIDIKFAQHVPGRLNRSKLVNL